MFLKFQFSLSLLMILPIALTKNLKCQPTHSFLLTFYSHPNLIILPLNDMLRPSTIPQIFLLLWISTTVPGQDNNDANLNYGNCLLTDHRNDSCLNYFHSPVHSCKSIMCLKIFNVILFLLE